MNYERIDDDQKLEIRSAMLWDELTPQQAAERFGVCLGTVHKLATDEDRLPKGRCRRCRGKVVIPCRKCVIELKLRIAAEAQLKEPAPC